MKSYYTDDAITLYHGNALDVLRTLPDESVQACVTSPPYWGLRDYGTARWEGGSASCDHVERRVRPQRDNSGGLVNNRLDSRGKQAWTEGAAGQNYRDICGKCGARRVDQQLGLEKTPEEYVQCMVAVFAEVRRVLKRDGVCWVNLGDSYAANRGYQVPDNMHVDVGNSRGMNAEAVGIKPKDLVGIPWRVAFALQADGWWLRQDIIWAKPNTMPESVLDRCTKAHEYVFMLTKSARYFYDAEAVSESSSEESGWAKQRQRGVNTWKYNDTDYRNAQTGQSVEGASFGTVGMRNRRSVWQIATQPYSEAHFATFPEELPRICIMASTRPGDVVLDPFNGAGTTGKVSQDLGRKYVGIDINAAYLDMTVKRTAQGVLPLEIEP